MKEVRDYVFCLWHDADYYDKPVPMTITEAAYNLREYKDGLDDVLDVILEEAEQEED